MAFSKKTDRYYMDEEDLDGAIRVLTDSIYEFMEKAERGEADEFDGVLSLITAGAIETIEIIKDNKHIDTGKRFALLFQRRIEERM